VGKRRTGSGVRRGENKRGDEVPLKKLPLPFAKGKGIQGLGFTK